MLIPKRGMTATVRERTIRTMTCVLILMSLFCVSVFGETEEELFRDIAEPETASIKGSKNGIVEIQAGVTDDQERFKKIKGGCGLLISNSTDGVYVVTTSHTIHFNKKEKKEVGENKTTELRIVVRGDVSSRLTLVADSRKQDFCVLQSDNVINEKTSVSLEDASETRKGDLVRSMGFRRQKENKPQIKYEARDVSVRKGHVAEVGGASRMGSVLFHTIKVDGSNDGGPLLNSDGHICGLNNRRIKDKKTNNSGALPILEIIKVLDNYDIQYRSRNTDSLYRNVYELCRKGNKKLGESKYKGDSKQELSSALELGFSVLRESPNDKDKLAEAEAALLSASDSLERKMPKSIWLILILCIGIIVQAIRLVKLVLWSRQHEDELPEEKEDRPADNKIRDDDHEAIKATETAVLGKTMKRPNALLHWRRDDAQIYINHSRFIIGKQSGMVNMAIVDNPAISRIHARIKWENGKYYLEDMGSSNGTFLNERKIDKEVLENGDLIRLADEEFIFEIV